MRKKIVTILYLAIVAMIPVFLGVYQVIHFLNWLLDWYIDFSFMAGFSFFSIFILILCFLISLYEHFCIYHRTVILAVLYCNLSCYIMDAFPSLLFYNITNIVAVIAILVGLTGCFIHFAYQIQNFIRYVRTKSIKNAH